MSRIIVLGGGRQGRVIAQELAVDHAVTVADLRPLELEGVNTLEVDLADPAAIEACLVHHDLAVGALPAELGYRAAQAAIAAGRHYVDIAFYPEDASTLDDAAKARGVTVIPDCGLAPGISHLVCGRALAGRAEQVEDLDIYVGGVAEDPSEPYGYTVTWSLPDLLDEYRRPARIVRDGAVVSVPALTDLELIDVPGIGTLEAFNTDGLRTLLELSGPRNMTEKTLRWPGHAEAVKDLMSQGRFVEEIGARCNSPRDLVVMLVKVDGESLTLIARPRDGVSAMARTTALTCAAFARLVADGGVSARGVVPPERIGEDPKAFSYILERLRGHGLELEASALFA